MKTRIYGSELQELVVETVYPECFRTDKSSFLERNYNAKHLLIEGSYREIFFEGIHIGYGDFKLPKTTSIYFDTDMETIEMHFALQGRARTSSKVFQREVDFNANQHNLIYANEFKGAIEWCAEKDMKVFEINLWPSFFTKYLPEGDLFDLFRKSIEKKEGAVLSPHNYPITPQMMTLIHQMLNCNRTGHFKRMFLESHVIELLMLQLEQISNHNCEVFCAANKQHEEKLYTAREILSQQLTGELTLNSLAHQVGTNEFTLKKGFKELFGTTVFGYWNEVKMQEAKTMLTEGKLNVAEVSARVGYKNPQHFSAAFKRYYGYPPSESRW
ncbi:helix-turn-helix transcriptional regulator [Fulvivirga sp. M361]|uniref:helix-turn-helix transcriptional regulator n=1 Tax=Fulvivirga sp. M361 TaxID=2594266 RepID=UPI001179AC53|nr:AraC family transcriptional regulator [Fulvivirga sp. M361]TRX54326.1 helix-turn-helix transcriptional regulator [Fulvivirga sp. M361]